MVSSGAGSHGDQRSCWLWRGHLEECFLLQPGWAIILQGRDLRVITTGESPLHDTVFDNSPKHFKKFGKSGRFGFGQLSHLLEYGDAQLSKAVGQCARELDFVESSNSCYSIATFHAQNVEALEPS